MIQTLNEAVSAPHAETEAEKWRGGKAEWQNNLIPNKLKHRCPAYLQGDWHKQELERPCLLCAKDFASPSISRVRVRVMRHGGSSGLRIERVCRSDLKGKKEKRVMSMDGWMKE